MANKNEYNNNQNRYSIDLIMDDKTVRKIFDIHNNIVVMINRHGKVGMINKYGAKLLGGQVKDIIGQDWFHNYLISNEKKKVKKYFLKLVSGKIKRLDDFENYIKTAVGERLIYWRNTILKDKQGKFFATLSSGFDITDRVNMYENLKARETIYKSVAESSIDCMKIVDLKGNLVYVNSSVFNNHNIKGTKNLIGKKLWDIPPACLKKEVKKDFSKLSGNKVFRKVYIADLPVNKKKYIERVYSPIKDSNGKLQLYHVQSRDISGRFQALADVEEARRKYATIVNKTGHLVYDYDIKTGKIKWEGAVKYITGYTPKEMAKECDIKHWEDWIHPEDREQVMNQLKKAQKAIATFDCIYRFKVKGGVYIYVRDEGVFLKNGGKKAVTMLGVMKDYSREQKEAKAKSDFVAIAAHQLRTPLTGIKWSLELLQKQEIGALNETQQEHLNNIYLNNNKLINLVSDLLDVSHIETGRKFDIVKKKNNICLLINDVVDLNKELIKRKKMKVEKHYKLCSNKSVYFDASKISQVMNNLLINALNYSPEGTKVVISTSFAGKELKVSVRDHGYGFLDKEKNRAFERFFRGTNILDKNISGTGLGLSIARSIIEAHGGKIWFESEINKGTNFYFQIPINKKKSYKKKDFNY